MIGTVKEKVKSLLPENQFSRAVSILVGGTAVAQALQLVTSPLLTRLYSPDAFGLLAVFVSIMGMLTVAGSLCYETAIPIPASDTESNSIVRISITILIAVATVILLFVWVIGDDVLEALSLEHLSGYKYLIPIALLFGGMYQIFTNWSVRKKRFGELSRTEVERSISTVAVQVVAFPLGPLGLILGQMTASGVGIWRLFKSYGGDIKHKNNNPAQLDKVSGIMNKYIRFPLYSLPNALLNSVGRQLPPIILAAAFTPAAAGLYYLANIVTQKPINLITGANAKVFVSHAPAAYRSGALGTLFSSVYAQTLKVVALPLTLAALLVPHLFGVIFGNQWQDAGLVAMILMPWVLMVALANPVSPIVGITNRQRTALYFEIILAFLRIGGLFIGIYFQSFLIAIALFSGGAVIGIALKVLWLAGVAGASAGRTSKLFLKEIAMAASVFGIGLAVYSRLGGAAFSLYVLISACFIGCRSGRAFVRGISLG